MSARGRVGFLLWFVLPVACCPQHAAMLEKRSPVMQIKFARSGGFAGAATNIEGTVAFDQKGDLQDQNAHLHIFQVKDGDFIPVER